MDEMERKAAEEELANEAGTGPFAFARRFRDVARFGFGRESR
jgi:hypothetical protein